MLLIAFAHPLEARPTIELLDAKPCAPHFFTFPQGFIQITGMGVGARTKTEGIREIWNLGLAGALSNELSIGQICPIRQVCLEEHPPLILGTKGYTLLTSPVPLWGQRPSLSADLVDMEGYSIVQKAQGIPCKLWKIVSDYAETKGSAELRKRLPDLAQKLAHFICSLVQTINHN
ncbi:MAG: hypothetical protein JSR80_02945 [Verrucomicrobia bacterium]|nr:hypothetical protein [Verrucomicrobiota bacterium]